MASSQLTDIAKIKNRPDPLLAFKWVVVAPYLPFGLPSTYVESLDLPFNNLSIGDGWYRAATFTYFPSTINISSFNIVLYEDDRATALGWVETWKSKVRNPNTGKYGLPSKYKKDLKVTLLDTNNELVLTTTLQGIWPAETSSWPLGQSNERLTLTQTFSVDGSIAEWHKTVRLVNIP
jgi:hypothetical protein